MLFRSRAVRAVLVVDDGKYHAMSAIDLGFIDDDSQRRSEGGPRKEGKEVVEGGRDWTYTCTCRHVKRYVSEKTTTQQHKMTRKDDSYYRSMTPCTLLLVRLGLKYYVVHCTCI